MNLSVKRTNEAAILPTRATPGSAAIDLYALNSVTLYVGQRVPVDTGIAVAIPEGYAGFLHSRSGHGLKHGSPWRTVSASSTLTIAAR